MLSPLGSKRRPCKAAAQGPRRAREEPAPGPKHGRESTGGRQRRTWRPSAALRSRGDPGPPCNTGLAVRRAHACVQACVHGTGCGLRPLNGARAAPYPGRPGFEPRAPGSVGPTSPARGPPDPLGYSGRSGGGGGGQGVSCASRPAENPHRDRRVRAAHTARPLTAAARA